MERAVGAVPAFSATRAPPTATPCPAPRLLVLDLLCRHLFFIYAQNGAEVWYRRMARPPEVLTGPRGATERRRGMTGGSKPGLVPTTTVTTTATVMNGCGCPADSTDPGTQLRVLPV